MSFLRAFQSFPNEAALVGRMVAGYADLEIDLMHCAKEVSGGLDHVLKAMFRIRGNADRIDVADALARQAYHRVGIGAQYEAAIAAVRFCLRIRNLYAHAAWWDDNTGQLAFANLAELAKGNVLVTNLLGLTVNHVTVRHLEAQLAYFDHADDSLVWVIQEGNRLAGRPALPARAVPTHAQPPLYL